MKKIKIISYSIALVWCIPYLMAQPLAKNDIKAKGTTADIMPTDQQMKVDMLVNNILGQYHYQKANLNDSLSSIIFDKYLLSLDPSKMYFMEGDIKNFEKYRYQLDEAIKEANLVPPYYIYNVFKRKLLERTSTINELLKTEFDFTVDEFYEFDREKLPWSQNQNDLNEVWRKFIKSQALSLKLTNKTWAEISKTLTDRFQRQAKNITQFDSEDVFQIYMNAFTSTFDPHTDYFSPVASQDFNIDMSRSVEGIGAQLTNENDFVKVADVVPGGPAFKSKLLHKGDKIVGVAQGDTGKVTDIVGWRTQDAVKLIRGAKGTTVRLMIVPVAGGENALSNEIKLVREKVKFEDQRAAKSVIEIKQKDKNYKIGVITLPIFYLDFEGAKKGEKDYNSTTRDVRKLITELENEKVSGIIMDLRYNGGGSLQEAIDLTGLFITKGPVVQVRNADGAIDLGEDKDPAEVYSGPLAILVNRFSASASEIFAAAIQDYKRGIIIGEQTYGKGTVQNLIDLNRFIPSESDKLGQLKLTMAKFYRINGSSTQLKGVEPDVAFPSAFSAEEYGESSQPNALPWDQIKSSKFTFTKDISAEQITKLRSSYQHRLSSNKELKELTSEIEEANADKLIKKISLQEKKRKEEQQKDERKKAAREALIKSNADSKDKSKDIYLQECGHVLTDFIVLKK